MYFFSKRGPSFKRTRIPFTKRCFGECFVELNVVGCANNTFEFCQRDLQFRYYLVLEMHMVL